MPLTFDIESIQKFKLLRSYVSTPSTPLKIKSVFEHAQNGSEQLKTMFDLEKVHPEDAAGVLGAVAGESVWLLDVLWGLPPQDTTANIFEAIEAAYLEYADRAQERITAMSESSLRDVHKSLGLILEGQSFSFNSIFPSERYPHLEDVLDEAKTVLIESENPRDHCFAATILFCQTAKESASQGHQTNVDVLDNFLKEFRDGIIASYGQNANTKGILAEEMKVYGGRDVDFRGALMNRVFVYPLEYKLVAALSEDGDVSLLGIKFEIVADLLAQAVRVHKGRGGDLPGLINRIYAAFPYVATSPHSENCVPFLPPDDDASIAKLVRSLEDILQKSGATPELAALALANAADNLLGKDNVHDVLRVDGALKSMAAHFPYISKEVLKGAAPKMN